MVDLHHVLIAAQVSQVKPVTAQVSQVKPVPLGRKTTPQPWW